MNVPRLDILALKSVEHVVWMGLDVHTQRCLFPQKYRSAISKFQRCILSRIRRQMAAFLELLEGQSRKHWTLAPVGTEQHLTVDAWKLLIPGDHIVVMIGGWRHGYAHHGIVISSYNRDGKDPQVAHFMSPSGDKFMRDAVLKITSHTDFLGAAPTFGIVPYVSKDLDIELHDRQQAVKIAELMVGFSNTGSLRLKYNLIAWNCECFAWLCKTGNIHAHSRQVERILHAIHDDLRKGEKSILLRTGAIASSSCIIS